MRLKSKYITLVALIILTATPRAFDQLADLKDFAQERFRAELRNIFWSLTPPDARRGDARQYSELLARIEQSASDCNCTDQIKAARSNKTTVGPARATTSAANLGHRQPFVVDEPLALNFVADAKATEPERNREFLMLDESAETDAQEAVLVARNFSDYPLYDENYGPVQIDDRAAQFEWSRQAEQPAAWRAKAVVLSQREALDAQRLKQKLIQTNFQIRLPENFDKLLNTTIINSDTLIEMHTVPAPAKPKCRVPVVPAAPEEAPRPSPKPALI